MGNSKTLNSRSLFKVAITTDPHKLKTSRPIISDQQIVDAHTVCVGTAKMVFKRLRSERVKVKNTQYRMVIQELMTKRFWELGELIEFIRDIDARREENRLLNQARNY